MRKTNSGVGKLSVPESLEGVSEQILELALLTLSGVTVTDAAKTLDISRSTAHRRMTTDAYRTVIAEARKLASRELLNSLLAMDAVALATLADGLVKVVSPSRLSALRIFVSLRQQLLEEVEIEDRITRLEELVRERGVIEGEAKKL